MKYLTFFLLYAVLAAVACSKLPKGTPLRKEPVQPKAVEKAFKFHIGILLEDSDGELSWCGGSLIDHGYVLTAAHCLEGIENATLYLGSIQHESGTSRPVKKSSFIIHSKYNRKQLLNDIALIRIPHTNDNEMIQRAKLFSNEKLNLKGKLVITTGWSHATNSSAGISNELQWSYMGAISNEECREFYGNAINPSHICIRSYGVLSTCRADSGGPLILESSAVQIGVSAFGPRKGCEKGTPLVYTRVSAYKSWIQSHISAQ